MSVQHILIGGEAGQGLVTVGELLSKSFVKHGYDLLVVQSYQSRIRGGHNTYSLFVGDEPVYSPFSAIDVLVALNNETVNLHSAYLAKDGVILADAGVICTHSACLSVPYKELASKLMENTVALGVLATFLGLRSEVFHELLHSTFKKKSEVVVEENIKVFDNACDWAKTVKPTSFKTLASPLYPDQRMMINGNQAIALGAIAAGVNFCSFYPMTPATSIALTLVSHADQAGIVVEQVEDEIAAINMAIGASYAGACALVPTSGGGFALMAEGVSLAGMTETPLVIVVAQRPGPATGLPTRTAQEDLEFVLHAGHGEFARAIFAPCTVADCFDLTIKAVELAEASQGPVFVLTDQFLADMYRSAKPFEMPSLSPQAALKAVSEDYKRYKLTQNGISERFSPGQQASLVIADSDEHTEDGHLTEDLAIRKLMVEKRLSKLCMLFERIIPPDYYGEEEPDLLLVSWGSTADVCKHAVSVLKSSGVKASALSFKQVWPLDARMFLVRLEQAKRVVFVEGNATGQFARLVRRETGFGAYDLALRYDGLPITAEYLLKTLELQGITKK